MKVFLFCSLLLLAIPACTDNADTVPAEIRGFNLWPPVTEKPVSVSSELWTLCVAPPHPEWKAMNSGPHKDGAISVRVNEIGRRLFMNEPNPVFPEGTVIVKEKLLSPEDTKPDSLGIMIKRTSGWEFAFVDHAGRVSRGREQLANCYDCHAAMTATDGVFRSYLAKQQRLAWHASAADNQMYGTLRHKVPSPP